MADLPMSPSIINLDNCTDEELELLKRTVLNGYSMLEYLDDDDNAWLLSKWLHSIDQQQKDRKLKQNL